MPKRTSRRLQRRCGGEPSSRPDASARDSLSSTRRCSPSSTAIRRRGQRACSTAAPSAPASRRTSGAEPESGPAHSAPGSTNSRSRAACTSATAGSIDLNIWCLWVTGRRPSTSSNEVCSELLEGFGQRIAGYAFYELGELHRLLGDPEAERDYRRARERGTEDQPGLALLRLSQGETESAMAGIRRALVEAKDPLSRLSLLPACVQIMLAAGDLESARAGSRGDRLDRDDLRHAGGPSRTGPSPRRGRAGGGRRGYSPRPVARGRSNVAGAGGAVCGRIRGGARRPGVPRARTTRTLQRPNSSSRVRRSSVSVRSPTCAGSRRCGAHRAGAIVPRTTGHALTSRELEVLALVAAVRPTMRSRAGSSSATAPSIAT